MVKRTQHIMLLGLLPGMSVEEAKATRDAVQELFPDRRVKVLGGLLSAHEFSVEVDDVNVEPKGGYL